MTDQTLGARSTPLQGMASLMLYLLRAAAVVLAARLLLRRYLAGVESLWWHDTLLSLVCQLDLYRSLCYALLPAVLLLLLIPRLKKRFPAALLLPLAAIAGIGCAWLVRMASGWTRPGIMPAETSQLPALLLGLNVAGLLWFHLGDRWTPRLRALLIKAVLLSDLLLPALLWSAQRRDNGRLFAPLRLFPCALLCAYPLLPWTLHPLSEHEPVTVSPEFSRIDGGVFYQAQYDSSADRLYLIDEHGTIERIALADGSRAQYEASGLRGVQAVALDAAAQRLLYLSPEASLSTLDANTLEPLRSTALADPPAGIQAGCRTAWDPERSILFVSCDSASLSLCPDGATSLALRPSLFQSDAQLDPRRDELYVLAWFEHQRALIGLDVRTLELRRSLLLPPLADRLALDPERDRAYVSFPAVGRVLELDLTAFRPTREIDAFVGVRAMAVDQRRGWLLLAGLSPVFEVRRLDDLELVARLKAPHWMRWIALDSRRDLAYVTSATLGVWSLDLSAIERGAGRPPRPDDPFFRLSVLAGRAARWTLFGDEQPLPRIEPLSQRLLSGPCPEGTWTTTPIALPPE